jgi:hypothetical protein
MSPLLAAATLAIFTSLIAVSLSRILRTYLRPPH